VTKYNITSTDPTDERPAPPHRWFCAVCRTMVATTLVNEVPVCPDCGTPTERHLAEGEP